MYIIKIASYKNINLFKLFFISLLYKWKKKFLIDFKDSSLLDNEIIDFLIKYRSKIKIKVLNIPYCINNFNFSIDDNLYDYNLRKECFYCSYSISCKGNYNVFNKIKSINNSNVLKHRKKIINWIKEVYLFLIKVWFKNEEIQVSSNKNILYFYLFEWYDMFFNWMKNKYFYKSEDNRLYFYLDNYYKCKDIFINKWKNLLFKNISFLKEYNDLMKNLDLDIILYGKEKYNLLLNNKKEIKKININNIDMYFIILKKYNLYKFYNKLYQNAKKNEFTSEISKNILKWLFKWKKIINWNKIKKIILEVINIENQNYSTLPNEFVLVWNDTWPKYLDEIIKSKCILLQRNNDISHWAIMSRELKKDCIYGIDWIAYNVNSWDLLEINFDTLEIKIIKKIWKIRF